MDPYEDIAEFFQKPEFDFPRTSPPFDIVNVTAKFEGEELYDIIPDRPQFFVPHMLRKALTFYDRAGHTGVLSLSSVTVAECEGHLPEQPMIPMISLAKIMALTARFLCALHTGRNTVVCEVEEGRSKSLFSLKTLRYAVPPADVIAYARILQKDKRRILTESRTWIAATGAFVPAAELTDFLYSVIPKRIFLAALRGES